MALYIACCRLCITVSGTHYQRMGSLLLYQFYGYWSFSCCSHSSLSVELMRLAIGRISDGELEYVERICRFVREIYREHTIVAPKMDDTSDMKTKMDTMLQSVMKIENVCFSVHVRGS